MEEDKIRPVTDMKEPYRNGRILSLKPARRVDAVLYDWGGDRRRATVDGGKIIERG